MKINQVIEGWRNNMFPPKRIKTLIAETSAERMAICEACKHHSKNYKNVRPDAHCIKCGCTLSAKTKCLSCACPLDKWVALVTTTQEEEITENGGE